MSWSAPGWVVVAILTPSPTYWIPGRNLCDRGNRLHLYRPNAYIDMYDDPRGGHWLR